MSLPPLSHPDTQKLVDQVDQWIEAERAALERQPTTEADSQFIRGRIAALRALRAWAQPPAADRTRDPENRRLAPPPNY